MRIKYALLDTVTMFKRCMLLSLRNFEALFTSIAQPVLLMLLFVYIFGGAMDVGDMDYVNFIVPGVILQCISQSASITAISVNNDMKMGIMNRFRSMPITSSSLLTGHAMASIVRNTITTSLVVGVALLIGFRPSAGVTQWLIVFGVLFLFIMAITWLSVVFGLTANSTESAQALTIIMILLPYFSSGFTPTETMPTPLRVFAENQPMTPIIEAVRSLLMNATTDENLFPALLWCVGILVVSYIAATQIYKKKIG